ncbi:hypothetical protein ACU686_15015 [Yinghuangia aomiensis]
MTDTGRLHDVVLEGGPAELAHRQHYEGTDPDKMALQAPGRLRALRSHRQNQALRRRPAPGLPLGVHTEIAE